MAVSRLLRNRRQSGDDHPAGGGGTRPPVGPPPRPGVPQPRPQSPAPGPRGEDTGRRPPVGPAPRPGVPEPRAPAPPPPGPRGQRPRPPVGPSPRPGVPEPRPTDGSPPPGPRGAGPTPPKPPTGDGNGGRDDGPTQHTLPGPRQTVPVTPPPPPPTDDGPETITPIIPPPPPVPVVITPPPPPPDRPDPVPPGSDQLTGVVIFTGTNITRDPDELQRLITQVGEAYAPYWAQNSRLWNRGEDYLFQLRSELQTAINNIRDRRTRNAMQEKYAGVLERPDRAYGQEYRREQDKTETALHVLRFEDAENAIELAGTHLLPGTNTSDNLEAARLELLTAYNAMPEWLKEHFTNRLNRALGQSGSDYVRRQIATDQYTRGVNPAQGALLPWEVRAQIYQDPDYKENSELLATQNTQRSELINSRLNDDDGWTVADHDALIGLESTFAATWRGRGNPTLFDSDGTAFQPAVYWQTAADGHVEDRGALQDLIAANEAARIHNINAPGEQFRNINAALDLNLDLKEGLEAVSTAASPGARIGALNALINSPELADLEITVETPGGGERTVQVKDWAVEVLTATNQQIESARYGGPPNILERDPFILAPFDPDAEVEGTPLYNPGAQEFADRQTEAEQTILAIREAIGRSSDPVLLRQYINSLAPEDVQSNPQAGQLLESLYQLRDNPPPGIIPGLVQPTIDQVQAMLKAHEAEQAVIRQQQREKSLLQLQLANQQTAMINALNDARSKEYVEQQGHLQASLESGIQEAQNKLRDALYEPTEALPGTNRPVKDDVDQRHVYTALGVFRNDLVALRDSGKFDSLRLQTPDGGTVSGTEFLSDLADDAEQSAVTAARELTAATNLPQLDADLRGAIKALKTVRSAQTWEHARQLGLDIPSVFPQAPYATGAGPEFQAWREAQIREAEKVVEDAAHRRYHGYNLAGWRTSDGRTLAEHDDWSRRRNIGWYIGKFGTPYSFMDPEATHHFYERFLALPQGVPHIGGLGPLDLTGIPGFMTSLLNVDLRQGGVTGNIVLPEERSQAAAGLMMNAPIIAIAPYTAAGFRGLGAASGRAAIGNLRSIPQWYRFATSADAEQALLRALRGGVVTARGRAALLGYQLPREPWLAPTSARLAGRPGPKNWGLEGQVAQLERSFPFAAFNPATIAVGLERARNIGQRFLPTGTVGRYASGYADEALEEAVELAYETAVLKLSGQDNPGGLGSAAVQAGLFGTAEGFARPRAFRATGVVPVSGPSRAGDLIIDNGAIYRPTGELETVYGYPGMEYPGGFASVPTPTGLITPLGGTSATPPEVEPYWGGYYDLRAMGAAAPSQTVTPRGRAPDPTEEWVEAPPRDLSRIPEVQRTEWERSRANPIVPIGRAARNDVLLSNLQPHTVRLAGGDLSLLGGYNLGLPDFGITPFQTSKRDEPEPDDEDGFVQGSTGTFGSSAYERFLEQRGNIQRTAAGGQPIPPSGFTGPTALITPGDLPGDLPDGVPDDVEQLPIGTGETDVTATPADTGGTVQNVLVGGDGGRVAVLAPPGAVGGFATPPSSYPPPIPNFWGGVESGGNAKRRFQRQFYVQLLAQGIHPEAARAIVASISVAPDNRVVVQPAAATNVTTVPQPTFRTANLTPTPAVSPTVATTPAVSVSPSPTRAATLSPTISPTVTRTLSPTISPTITRTLSPTISPTISPTFSPSPTLTPTFTPTLTPTFSPALTPTYKVDIAPEIITQRIPEPLPEIIPRVRTVVKPAVYDTPTPTITPIPTITPTRTPTRTYTPSPNLPDGGDSRSRLRRGRYPRLVSHIETREVVHDLDTGETQARIKRVGRPRIQLTDLTPPPQHEREAGHRTYRPRGRRLNSTVTPVKSLPSRRASAGRKTGRRKQEKFRRTAPIRAGRGRGRR